MAIIVHKSQSYLTVTGLDSSVPQCQSTLLAMYLSSEWHGSRDLPSQPPGSHFDSQTQDFRVNNTQFNLVRFSVNVESKGIFQIFYSYKTMGILNDVKKQTCLAVSI